MSGPLVKICGLRSAHHAAVAAEAGAEMVGLVFAESRRRVTPAEARAVTMAYYARRPRFVGVFVNEDPEAIGRLAGEVRLDLAQLSGQESPAACARLRVPYMKVVHVRDGMAAGDVLSIARQYPAAVAIVLDSAGRGHSPAWGGSGVSIDLDVAAEVARRAGRPLLLAGGLRPDNVAQAIEAVDPWGVDVSSGVETDGLKDEQKIAAFVVAAKRRAP